MLIDITSIQRSTMMQQKCNMSGGIDQNKRDDHTKTARIENRTSTKILRLKKVVFSSKYYSQINWANVTYMIPP